MNVLTGKVLMNEKDPHELETLQGFRLTLKLSQQQLQITRFAKIDLSRQTHSHPQEQKRSTLEFQLLAIQPNISQSSPDPTRQHLLHQGVKLIKST